MASAANGAGDDELITGINVTPLVDVTLVLLVTAGYVAPRGLPLDLPKAATAEAVPRTLTISVARDGATYLDGAPVEREALRARVRAAARADPEIRAIIAADGRASHADVV